MNPFIYPKTRHRRQLQPGPFKVYQRYKPFLKKEFSSQCVYCRLPDGLKGSDTFGVDHYLPKCDFPHLATIYSNLFYSCNTCNRRKSDFWPTSKFTREGKVVVNPCDHVMFEHLRYNSEHVEARTPEGNWTKDILDLNEPKAVKHRELVLILIESLISQKAKIALAIKTIEARIISDASQREALLKEKALAQQLLEKVELNLNRVLSEPEIPTFNNT